MKKIVYFVLFTLLVGFSSCTDFLTEDPKANVTVDKFYNNPADVRSALNAVYAGALSDINSCNFVWLNEVTADDVAVFINVTQGPVPDRVALEQLTYHSELTVLKNSWASHSNRFCHTKL